MVELGDHTKLMNIIIGLCYNVPKWPNPFLDEGYKLSKIELKIPQSNPDVIITNKRKSHVIVIECKSSNHLKELQMAKYNQLRENPHSLLQSGKIQITHEKQLSIDTIYSSFQDLSFEELICKYNMLCWHILRGADSKIESINLTRGSFKKKNLDKIFPIDTKNLEPPYFLYPFDENDIEVFIKELLNQVQSFAYKHKSFTIPQILEKCHSLWKYIDDNKKFERKAYSILLDLQKRGLKRYLIQDKATGEWTVIIKNDARSYQAFQKRCNDIVIKLDLSSYQETLDNKIGT